MTRRATRDESARAKARKEGELRATRIVWLVLVAAAFALGSVSLPAYYHDIRSACSGAVCSLDGALSAADIQALGAARISPQMYANYTLALYCGASLVWLAVALLIFARRANDRGALLIALILATANMIAVNGPMTALALAHPNLTWPINVLATLSDVTYTLLFLLFPDGRFVPSWTRWVALAQFVISAATHLLPSDSVVNAPNSPIAAALSLAPLGIFVAAIYAQVYRYRRVSSPRQREQSKWAVFGLLLASSGVMALNVGSLVAQQALGGVQPSEIIMNTLFPLVLLAVPVAIGIAILRSRLYDIDIIIKRTLVYGSLTAILAALYFALVIGAQTLTSLLSGQHVGQQPVVIVLSTLLIAALVQPLRRRLQGWIDQRFYRSRYDAAKTVMAFNATLRNEVDLAQLNAHLLAVVDDTMRPTHISLWLRPHGAAPLTAAGERASG
ncbi:MAG TPA: hypothetical protein VE338_01475 [Ktedonobacterales bacterium]|jgi:hypothetical protein|nr:hypothetical protein [Ktedonobacterales bacterium]